MRIHKDGFGTIFTFLLFSLALSGCIIVFPVPFALLCILGSLACIFLFYGLFCIFFFRNPKREITLDENAVIAPADGTVISIEEYFEDEYFQQSMQRISIFMSPMNVHVNSYPVGGNITYCKYHKGKHLVADSPKSSLDNERNTVVVKTDDGVEVLFRQIAGCLARRIVSYAKKGAHVGQGEEMGVIKLGSRVDIFLPLGTEILVKIGDKTTAQITKIAKFN